MTPREYRARTDSQWRGVKVRARQPLGTANLMVPAGMVLTIERKYQGFSLIGLPCTCCGVWVRITRVEPHNVEVVE